MTKTEHYQLNQWVPEDRVLRTDFNEDNAKIDAAIAEAKQAADAAKSGAGTALDAKAGELTQAIEGVNTALEQETADRKSGDAVRGNCQVVVGTYTGNDGARTLTFDHKPMAVFVQPEHGVHSIDYSRLFLFSGGPIAFGLPGDRDSACTVTWSGNSVSWNGSDPLYRCNAVGYTYRYAAFLAMDK